MRDPLVERLIKLEEQRQQCDIPLIASENICSADVRAALGSVFTDKYAEGKVCRRYYAGNQIADRLERLAQNRARRLFLPRKLRSKWHVNVQPLSGSPANLAVYAALLNPGDAILSMNLATGGHLSHGHAITLPGRLYRVVQYGVDKTTERLDYDAIERLAKKEKPKLIIAGASAYPRQIDFARFGKIARAVGAYLLADISHLAGLIAGGTHPSPIPHADVVMTTTHKTLRGPRAAIVLCRPELATQIDKGIFPGVQGGPHLNQIAAVAVALREALQPAFRAYARRVVKNARAFAAELTKDGWRIISGGTDTHLILADASSVGFTGRQVQRRLERAGIICNANAIPFDARPPADPSGVRFGTAAITTRGYTQRHTRQIARHITELLRG